MRVVDGILSLMPALVAVLPVTDRDGNFVFYLPQTECLVEMQIHIEEYIEIDEESHVSYEVGVALNKSLLLGGLINNSRSVQVCRSLGLVGDLPDGQETATTTEGSGCARRCWKGTFDRPASFFTTATFHRNPTSLPHSFLLRGFRSVKFSGLFSILFYSILYSISRSNVHARDEKNTI